MRLRVTAGPHIYKNCPLSTPVEIDGLEHGEAVLVGDNGLKTPCQVCGDNGKTVLTWVERELAPGEVKNYFLEAGCVAKSRVQITDAGDNRLNVFVGGDLFTRYNYSPCHPRPFLYPFYSHDGAHVTRHFPMREDIPDEDTDHKHHRSVWIAYGEVNGTDNWCENKDSGRIVHRSLQEVSSGPVFGRIRTENIWTSLDGAVQMTDLREFTFYNVQGERLMDIKISFCATEGDVLLGDTKEGGIISVRVASSMDGAKAGMIVNSYGGKTEAETWGRPAQWVDYFGPVGAQTYGITIMDHPSSFRYPTRWHVRDYGLFAANPFALKAYEPDRAWSGDHTIRKGEQIDFRYRLYVHSGDTWSAGVSERYFCFAAPPTVKPEA